MYKVSYYLTGGALRFKSFHTFHEASVFANQLKPVDCILEIKYYEEVNNKKPDRS